MGRKKGQGAGRNGRDTAGKRRGIKVYGGETIKAGGIIVRQLGTVFHPGINVGMGRDYTLYATADGVTTFNERKGRKVVDVVVATPQTV